MTQAALSLLALVLTILIGALKPKINIGVLAIAISLILGVFFFGMTEKEIAAMFPSNLFLMLVGVTALFGIAAENGTLQQITSKITSSIKGHPQYLPLVFFFLTFLLSSAGPGNIAATAVIAPIAIAAALYSGTSVFLMSIMVCTGANAGAFSPIAPTGVILIGLMQKIGIEDQNLPWIIYLAAAAIQTISALLAYFILNHTEEKKQSKYKLSKKHMVKETAFINREQKLTLAAAVGLIVLVAVFNIPISVASFGLVFVLLFAISVQDLLKLVPWDAIILVTGVTVLVGLLEKAGGLNLAVTLLTRVSNENSINAVLSLVTGIVSAYSSSSGVVMPTFITLLPGIAEQIEGVSFTKMLIAVSVGSHMVDVSPLSTLGALCIAAVPKELRNETFKKLMIWGLSMALLGALLSYLFLDLTN